MTDDSDRLPMWTVYDHPSDFPDYFVARKFFTLPEVAPSGDVVTALSLERLRAVFQRMGLVCLARNVEDDPCIVETWL
jgi:hypothetical protein